MNNQISNTNNIPIFPISEPQHFSDYGFDPQIDYFQVLEEARKQKIRDHHFKLQKPTIQKDESSKKIKKNKKRWWTNALHFFKSRKWVAPPISTGMRTAEIGRRTVSISGPVYVTESRCHSSKTPYRTGSVHLKAGEVEIPYLSLRELNMDHQMRRVSTTNARPIYLVT